jgi:type 2 lantibiotic biosynthesis protein LanM
LNVETVLPMLGSILLVGDISLPSWVQVLENILQTAQNFSARTDRYDSFPLKLPTDYKQPIPFEDVLLPVVLAARHMLMAQMQSISSSQDLVWELLEEDSYLSIERSLLQTLSNLCSTTLNYEFSEFRASAPSLLDILIGEKNIKNSIYSNFVNKLLRDGLLNLFKKYPVLAKLIAIKIDFWCSEIGCFLGRLKDDLSEIKKTFFNKEESSICSKERTRDLGKLTKVETFVSDPHCNGKSVIIVTFKSEVKLVYKPKSLGLDIEYFKLLEWLNYQGLSLPFKIAKILDRQDYGWVEYVKHTSCSDTVELQNFYERAGMLLCLLYALNASDCHRENLIACGEHLVLIDIEGLMQHRVNSLELLLEDNLLQIIEDGQLSNSVLQTGLLPFWRIDKDKNVAYDTSALGSIEPVTIPYQLAIWERINTDNMQVIYEIAELAPVENVPLLHGNIVSPNNYVDRIISGFERMYFFLIEQQKNLYYNSNLAAFEFQQVRFVFRPTQVYSVILNRALLPEFLQSGVKFSIELEYLCRAFIIAQNKPHNWQVFQAELKALEQLDIPYFGAGADSSALTYGVEKPVEHLFKEPSYSYVINRLKQMNSVDLNNQVKIIRGAFDSKAALHSRRSEGWKDEYPNNSFSFADTDVSQINFLTHEQLLEESNRLGQEIKEQAVRLADGSVNWLMLELVPETERFMLRFLDESLYKGRLGVALFLAALDYKQGTTHFNDLVLSALYPLREVIQISVANLPQVFPQNVGLGGTEGLGSIIYCLVKISHFLQTKVFLEDAQQVSNLITFEQIAADRTFDIMTGSAGTILALLVLYSETEDPALLDKATACGWHLLNNRINTNTSYLAWKNIAADKPLTGFSHGAAGIAYALLRLYAITKNREFLKAAKEGIAYERSVFSKSSANWPDFRDPDQMSFGSSWCHGAPGIGLARLGSLSILQEEEILQEAEIALETTRNIELWGKDCLCCGNFGRFEVLLTGDQKLAKTQFQETIHRQIAGAVARAKINGAYHLFPNRPRAMFNPTFFQGTAGIGYQLLRLAYPNELPSVLLLE